MNFESVEIPSERVPPVASDQSSRSKTVAGLLLFFSAVMLMAMLGALSEGQHKPSSSDTAEKTGHAIGTAIGLFLIAGLPGIFGIRAARNASRATRASKVASTDTSYTWRLFGKDIFAADGAGVPHPELSFKINGKLRTMLLHVPRASVVDPR